MYKLNAAIAATLALAAGTSAADAAVFVFNAGTTVYTQNFNTLASSGTTNAFSGLPAGVLAVETGTAARRNDAYAASTGSDNAGDVYSFGASSADRAFGTLRSGTLSPVIGFGFTNNSGRAITELAISFAGEQWRLGTTGRSDRLDFQYGLGTSSLTSGSFTDVDDLDFASVTTTGTAGARDGNVFRTLKAANITGLNIAQGQSFVFRFNDVDATGADDGLAIDDFQLSLSFAPVVTPVPEPATWAMMIGGFGLLGAAARRRSSNRVLA